MKLGIVGSEGAKFTEETERLAKIAIRRLIAQFGADGVVSGACHLGGIDVWVAEIGRELGLEVLEFPPVKRQWEGGYKQRNLQIVSHSDAVVCITLKELPPSYKGMTFSHCYHCKTDSHVKSGGCWTMKQAEKAGKPTKLVVIEEAI